MIRIVWFHIFQMSVCNLQSKLAYFS